MLKEWREGSKQKNQIVIVKEKKIHNGPL